MLSASPFRCRCTDFVIRNPFSACFLDYLLFFLRCMPSRIALNPVYTKWDKQCHVTPVFWACFWILFLICKLSLCVLLLWAKCFCVLHLDPMWLGSNNIVRSTTDCMALPKAALFSESVKLRKIKMSDIIIRLVKFLISTVKFSFSSFSYHSCSSLNLSFFNFCLISCE